MKKWGVLAGLVALLLSANGNIAHAEDDFTNGRGSIPAGAQAYADTGFLVDVKRLVDGETPSDYNLTKDGNITFGPLFPIFRLTSSFTENREISGENPGVIQQNEWISVVYQKERPVNVIGTYKKENGQYTMSSFGYGKELAETLSAIAPSKDQKIIRELSIDGWYLFEAGTVKALNESSKSIFPEAMSIREFQSSYIQQYNDAEPVLDDASVGGAASESNEKPSFQNPWFLYGSMAFVLTLAVSALIIAGNRKRAIE